MAEGELINADFADRNSKLIPSTLYLKKTEYAMIARQREPKMTNREIRTLRKRLGWSQKRLGDELGVHWVSVNRWENGKAHPSRLAQHRLEELKQKEVNDEILR